MSTTTPPPTSSDAPVVGPTPHDGDAPAPTAGRPSAPPPAPPAPPAPAARPAADAPRAGLPLRSYVAVAAVSALAAAAVVLPAQRDDAPATTGAADEVAAAPADATPLADAGDVVAAVADQLAPSVVRIDVRSGQGQGSGSGVALDADGHVLTNAHVVGDAREVSVLTPSGRRLEAEVVGADATSDIAVVRVDEALPVPTFATAEPRVGATTVAIGSPFGLDGTITAGIVSGVGRNVPGPVPLLDMLQTDAAINPGNSGGALADAAGRVIGINTAILSRSGANDGVGFAVPIGTALDVAEQLIETGEVRSGWLGIEGQSVDPQVAEASDLDVTAGAIIVRVVPGSAADDAGLREGDVVVAVDGEDVATMTDLAAIVRRLEPGEATTLDVVRGDDREQVEVTLGERPEGLVG